MDAHLEITGGVIRVFSDNTSFGKPFVTSVFVSGDETKAVLKGLKSDKLSINVVFAIERCLKAHGFTECVWYRWKTDKNGVLYKKIIIRKLI